MTDITLTSGSALTTFDPRANEALALANLVRSLRSGQAVSVNAGGFSVISDRLGIASSAQFAASVEAASSATANATHAVSLLTTARDALSQIADKLGTLAGLAADAADTSLSSQDRAQINSQFQTVKGEINDLAANTQFDGINLLAGNGSGGALEIDYQVGTGSSAANKIDVQIGDASTAGLSASLASADLTTSADASAAANAVTDAQEALGSIQGTVAGDITRVGSAYLAVQDQAAVNENTRSALVDPAVAANLAQRTADNLKKDGKLPLSENVDRQLIQLLGRLDTMAAADISRANRVQETTSTIDSAKQPLTPEPAAAINQNGG